MINACSASCRSVKLSERQHFILFVIFLQVYQFSSDSYVAFDQRYGRGLTKETLKEGEIPILNSEKIMHLAEIPSCNLS